MRDGRADGQSFVLVSLSHFYLRNRSANLISSNEHPLKFTCLIGRRRRLGRTFFARERERVYLLDLDTRARRAKTTLELSDGSYL